MSLSIHSFQSFGLLAVVLNKFLQFPIRPFLHFVLPRFQQYHSLLANLSYQPLAIVKYITVLVAVAVPTLRRTIVFREP